MPNAEVLLPSQSEITRRYDNIRATMREQSVDALIVCGNQYAGFEGAVFYTSGFEIVHRYVYVLIPLQWRADAGLSARGALDRRQEEALRERQSLGRHSGPLAARTCTGRRLEARRRLRPRLT